MLKHVPRQTQNDNTVTMETKENDLFYPDDYFSSYYSTQVVATDVTISTNTAPRDSIIKHFIPHVDYTLDDSWLYSLGPLGLDDDDEDDEVECNQTVNGSNTDYQIDTTPTQYLSHIYGKSKSDSEDNKNMKERPRSGSWGRSGNLGKASKQQHLKYGMVYENKDANNNILDAKQNGCKGEHSVVHNGSGKESSRLTAGGSSEKSCKSPNAEIRRRENVHRDKSWKSPYSESTSKGKTWDSSFRGNGCDDKYSKNENRNAEDILKSPKKENSQKFLKSPKKENGHSEKILKSPIIRREKIRYVSDVLENPTKPKPNTSQKPVSYMNGSIEPENERTPPTQSKPTKAKKEESYFEKIKNKKTDNEKKINGNNLPFSKDKGYIKDSSSHKVGKTSNSRQNEKDKTKKSRSSTKSDIHLIKDISLGDLGDEYEICTTNPQLERENFFSSNMKCTSERVNYDNREENPADENPNVIAFNTHIKHKDDNACTSTGKIAKTVKTVLKTIPFGSTKKDTSRPSSKCPESYKVKSKSLTPLTAQAMVMGKLHQNMSNGTRHAYKTSDSLQTSNNTNTNTAPTSCRSIFKSLRSSSADKIDLRSSKKQQETSENTKTSPDINIKSKGVYSNAKCPIKSNENVKLRVLFSQDDTAWAFKRRNSFGPSCTRKQSVDSVEGYTRVPCSTKGTEDEENKQNTLISVTNKGGEASRTRSKSFTPSSGANTNNSNLFFHERILPTSTARSTGNLRDRRESGNHEKSKSCDNVKLRSKSCERTTLIGSRVAHERIVTAKSYEIEKMRSKSCERTTLIGNRIAHERIVTSKSYENIKMRSKSCEGVKMRCIFYKEDEVKNGLKVRRTKSFGEKTNIQIRHEKIVKSPQQVNNSKSQPNLKVDEEDLSVPERLSMQEKLLQDLENVYRSGEARHVPMKSTKTNSVPPTTNTTQLVHRQSLSLNKSVETQHFWKNLELGLRALQHDLNSHEFDSDFDRLLIENEIETDLLFSVPDSNLLQRNPHLSFRNGEKLSIICEMFRNEDMESVDPQVKEQTTSISPHVNKESCSNITSNQVEKGSHVDEILSSEFERGFHLDDILSTPLSGGTRLLARDKLKNLRIKERVKELRDANMNAREILNVLLLDVIRDKPSNIDVIHEKPSDIDVIPEEPSNTDNLEKPPNETDTQANEEMKEEKEIAVEEKELDVVEKEITEEEEKEIIVEETDELISEMNSDGIHFTPRDDKTQSNKRDKIRNTEEILKKELKIIEELFQNIDSKQLLKELNINDETLSTMMRTLRRDKVTNVPVNTSHVEEQRHCLYVTELDDTSTLENANLTPSSSEILASKEEEIVCIDKRDERTPLAESLDQNLGKIEEPDTPIKIEEPDTPIKIEEPDTPIKIEEPNTPIKIEEPNTPIIEIIDLDSSLESNLTFDLDSSVEGITYMDGEIDVQEWGQQLEDEEELYQCTEATVVENEPDIRDAKVMLIEDGVNDIEEEVISENIFEKVNSDRLLNGLDLEELDMLFRKMNGRFEKERLADVPEKMEPVDEELCQCVNLEETRTELNFEDAFLSLPDNDTFNEKTELCDRDNMEIIEELYESVNYNESQRRPSFYNISLSSDEETDAIDVKCHDDVDTKRNARRGLCMSYELNDLRCDEIQIDDTIVIISDDELSVTENNDNDESDEGIEDNIMTIISDDEASLAENNLMEEKEECDEGIYDNIVPISNDAERDIINEDDRSDEGIDDNILTLSDEETSITERNLTNDYNEQDEVIEDNITISDDEMEHNLPNAGDGYNDGRQSRVHQLIAQDEFCLSLELNQLQSQLEYNFEDYTLILSDQESLFSREDTMCDADVSDELTHEEEEDFINVEIDELQNEVNIGDNIATIPYNDLEEHEVLSVENILAEETRVIEQLIPLEESSELQNQLYLDTAVVILSDTNTTSIENETIIHADKTLPQIVEGLCETVRNELGQHVDSNELQDGIDVDTTVLIMAHDKRALIEKEALIHNDEEFSQMLEELCESVNSNQLLNENTSADVSTINSKFDIDIDIDLSDSKNIEIVTRKNIDKASKDLPDGDVTSCDNDIQHITTESKEELWLSVNSENLQSCEDSSRDNKVISVFGENPCAQIQTISADHEQEIIQNIHPSTQSEDEVTFDIFIPSEGENTSLTIEIIIGDDEDQNTEEREVSCQTITLGSEADMVLEESDKVSSCEGKCLSVDLNEARYGINLVHDTETTFVSKGAMNHDGKSMPKIMKQLYECVDLEEVLNGHIFDAEILHSASFLDANITKNVESLIITENGSIKRGGSSRMASPSDLSVFSLEDIDSGTDLQYDDLFSPTDSKENDSDYNTWLNSIKPLLIDSEVVANLFVRLANKYSEYKALDKKAFYMQQVHMATTAYDVITDNNLTNFAHVISHLLSFVGAIKCERQLPENINIANILLFLEQLVEKGSLSTFHITLFTVLLSRPNEKLKRYHTLRVKLLHTCFVQEIRRLKITAGELYHLNICFMKISEYFVHLDKELSSTLIDEYILPNLTIQTSMEFITSVLQYMDLLEEDEKRENAITTNDISSSLILLSMIYKRKPLSTVSTQKLYTLLKSDHPKFRFCDEERKMLMETLRDLKYSGCKLLDP